MTHTRVTLIRHGRSAWNAEGPWQGQANVGLDEVGFVQAVQVAEHLKIRSESTHVAALYSSDLLRARQTAEAIAACLSLSVHQDTRLREIDMGEWQGMTGEEVALWDGERLAQVRAGGIDIPRPSGESLSDVAVRARSVFDEILVEWAGQHVVFVSHGGTIRMLLYSLCVLDPQKHVHIDNTSRTMLSQPAPDAAWQLDAYNQVDHLIEAEKGDPPI